MTGAAGFDVLGAIVGAARRRVETDEARVSLAEIERRASHVPSPRGRFRNALAAGGGWRVIAECKRRSPSRGVLRADYAPVAIAGSYAAHGASAVSVLTEPSFFDGALSHLRDVALAVDLPALRKDFVVDRYQVFEARAARASAVLLIVAALGEGELARLLACADEAGLDVLVEAHDADEVRRAVDAGAEIIGVNNRNLRTLAVNVGTSEELGQLIPRDRVAVAESGLRTGADLARLARAGYDAFLVGERLMAAPEPGRALAALVAEAGAWQRGPRP